MTTLPALQNDADHEIFAPVPEHEIAKLVEERHEKRECIDRLAEVANGDGLEGVIEYFTTQTRAASVHDLFDRERAKKALDAQCWRRALRLTDIYDILPQERRDEWDELIDNRETPDFIEENVGPTLSDLLAKRPKFMAERVDGLFRSLSGEHVTNSPWGFGKRMILAHVTDKYKMVNHSQCGHINDLRAVIAKIEGRGKPPHGMTRDIIRRLREDTGTWYDVDGGAMKIRVYKKGTAHIEIHPDMAWKLNAILSHLHPRAIPSEHREPPPKKHKDVEVVQNLLPFPVLELLDDLKIRGQSVSMRSYRWGEADKHLRQKARGALKALGGVVDGLKVRFDYDPTDAIDHVLAVGATPDQKSHQYYATPDDLAAAAVEWADIGPEHRCLEPSAGQGAIAKHIPDRTQCVEISELHAEVLRSKGFDVDCADFLGWLPSDGIWQYPRIVMNPPYSEGRWQEHLRAAYDLLAPGGVLVAILPESARGNAMLSKADVEWSEPRSFPGVSIDVVMMRAEKGPR